MSKQSHETPVGFAHEGGHNTSAEFAGNYNQDHKAEVEHLSEAGAGNLAPNAWVGAQTALALMGSEGNGSRKFASGDVTIQQDGSYRRSTVEDAPRIEDGRKIGEGVEPDFKLGGAPVSVEIVDSLDFAHTDGEVVDIDNKTRRTIVAIKPIAGTARSREFTRGGEASIPAILPIVFERTPYDISVQRRMGGNVEYPKPNEQITDLVVEFADDMPRTVVLTRPTGRSDHSTETVRISVDELLKDQQADREDPKQQRIPRFIKAEERAAAEKALELVGKMFSDAEPELETIKGARRQVAEFTRSRQEKDAA